MHTQTLEGAIEKVSRVLTHRYGMEVIFQGNSCHTDGKTIYLPSLPDDVPDDLVNALRGWADHECAHAIFTKTDVKSDFVEEHGEEAFSVLNVMEDARVEELMAQSYPGAGLNIERGFRYITKMAKGRSPSSPIKAFTAALYTRATGHEDLPYLPDGAYQLADRCQSEIAQVKSCTSTSKVADLAAQVWEKVSEDLGDIGQPSGEDDTGESDHDKSGNSQDAADPAQPDPTGEAPSDQPSASEGDRQDAADSSPSSGDGADIEQADGSDESAEPTGETEADEGQPHPDADHSPMGQLQRHINQEMESRDAKSTYRVYTREHDEVEVPDADRSYKWRQKIKEFRPQISGLLRKLIHTLRGREEKRWLRHRTRGKLDPGSLHKLATGTSNRIFRRRTETDDGPTACTLLLDLSSSMAGKQVRMARRLALIFGETLSRLSYPTEIIGFSTVDHDLRNEVIRETGQPREELAKRYSRMVPLYHALIKRFDEPFPQGAARMGNAHTRVLTPLGESLIFSGKRLASRPESRRVLFCLTDGKPVVGAWDESATVSHACESVGRLNAAGIEPVGIGIQEISVRDIFPRHVVINDLDQLATGFARELCEVLTQPKRKTRA